MLLHAEVLHINTKVKKHKKVFKILRLKFMIVRIKDTVELESLQKMNKASHLKAVSAF